MPGLLDTLGGCWELIRLGIRSRGLRGPYWQWRKETAFGSDPRRRPPRREQIRQVMAFGRWIYRMKRDR